MVDRILALGDDQLASQFQLVFPNGLPGGGDGQTVTLRADQNFEIPERGVGTYEIPYKGMKVLKTNKNESTEKTYTFDVRLDQQWKVYDDLLKWQNIVYDDKNGVALPDITTRTTMLFQTTNGENQVVSTIKFHFVKLHKMKITAFGHEEEGPARISLTFIYGRYEKV